MQLALLAGLCTACARATALFFYFFFGLCPIVFLCTLARTQLKSMAEKSVSQCYTRPSTDDGAHALAEHTGHYTRGVVCVRSQGKASPQTKWY